MKPAEAGSRVPPCLHEPETRRQVKSLTDLALEGMERMFLPARGSFCHRVVMGDGGAGLLPEGTSLHYACISAIGLAWAEVHGHRPRPLPGDLVKGLVDNELETIPTGDLGLLLWAASLIDKDYARRAWLTLWQRRESLGHLSPMVAAWVLSGLLNYLIVSKERGEVEFLIRQLRKVMFSNYVPATGLFRLGSPTRSINLFKGRFKRCVASFASHIYPIYAAAKMGEMFGDKDALNKALACAKTLTKLQGPLGQWWWFYNVENGSVAEEYPVFSVHQDGMAPMALLLLERVTGREFSPQVAKGLNWLFGTNELGLNLVDPSLAVIWRGIRPREVIGRYSYDLTAGGWLKVMASALGIRLPGRPRGKGRLVPILECRPYHLGWVLVAFGEAKL